MQIVSAAGANLGGLVGYIRLIPAASVLAVATLEGAATAPLQLRAGTEFCDVWFTPGSAQFTEEGERTEQGLLYKQKLVLQVHHDAPNLAGSFARLAQLREFVALLLTHNGIGYLVGTPEWPLRLATSQDTGRRLAEGSSRGLQLVADNPVPATVYPFFELAGAPQSGTVPGTTTPGGTTGGGSTVSVAFDWNRPITAAVPGLQGKVAGGTTLAAGLENLLFEPLGPTASLNLSPADFDYTPLATEDVDVFYTATPRGAALAEVRLDGMALPLAATGSTSGDLTKTVPANVSRNFQLSVRDAAGKTASASAAITFWHRRYVFASALDLLALLDQDEEMQVSQAVLAATAGERSTGRQLSTTQTLAGQRLYYVLPEAWGVPALSVNGLPNNDIVSRVFDLTTATGYTLRARLVATSIGNATYNFLFF